jgi:hypothetical protein
MLGGHEGTERHDLRAAGVLADDHCGSVEEDTCQRLPPGGQAAGPHGFRQQREIRGDPGSCGKQTGFFLGQRGCLQCRQSFRHLVGGGSEVASVQCLLGEAGVQRPGEPGILRSLAQRGGQLRGPLMLAAADRELELQELQVPGDARR